MHWKPYHGDLSNVQAEQLFSQCRGFSTTFAVFLVAIASLPFACGAHIAEQRGRDEDSETHIVDNACSAVDILEFVLKLKHHTDYSKSFLNQELFLRVINHQITFTRKDFKW